MPSAGWRFSLDKGEWVEAEAASIKPFALGRPLRLATLNVLFDFDAEATWLKHGLRQAAVCRELKGLDADVIGLNEVTRPMMERLLREEWVRTSYTLSVVSIAEGRAEGNMKVLLSKIPPVSVEYAFLRPGDGFHLHCPVMTLSLCAPHGGQPLRIAVCSTHLIACPWLMEGRRKRELAHLTSTMPESVDACVVMGDFNFHREAENASIPSKDGWGEVPAIVDLGETWDFGKNAMLAHYLPLKNFYNGFGLGASFGWPSPMRLDRVIVKGNALDLGAAKARLFANEPVHERARGQPPPLETSALQVRRGLDLWAHRASCAYPPARTLTTSAARC